jgi:hypothetical protein
MCLHDLVFFAFSGACPAADVFFLEHVTERFDVGCAQRQVHKMPFDAASYYPVGYFRAAFVTASSVVVFDIPDAFVFHWRVIM